MVEWLMVAGLRAVAGVGVEELVGGLASKFIYLFCYSPIRGQ
jgi:hypothetical protein